MIKTNNQDIDSSDDLYIKPLDQNQDIGNAADKPVIKPIDITIDKPTIKPQDHKLGKGVDISINISPDIGNAVNTPSNPVKLADDKFKIKPLESEPAPIVNPLDNSEKSQDFGKSFNIPIRKYTELEISKLSEKPVKLLDPESKVSNIKRDTEKIDEKPLKLDNVTVKTDSEIMNAKVSPKMKNDIDDKINIPEEKAVKISDIGKVDKPINAAPKDQQKSESLDANLRSDLSGSANMNILGPQQVVKGITDAQYARSKIVSINRPQPKVITPKQQTEIPNNSTNLNPNQSVTVKKVPEIPNNLKPNPSPKNPVENNQQEKPSITDPKSLEKNNNPAKTDTKVIPLPLHENKNPITPKAIPVPSSTPSNIEPGSGVKSQSNPKDIKSDSVSPNMNLSKEIPLSKNQPQNTKPSELKTEIKPPVPSNPLKQEELYPKKLDIKNNSLQKPLDNSQKESSGENKSSGQKKEEKLLQDNTNQIKQEKSQIPLPSQTNSQSKVTKPPRI
jgi:hypothetical protein